MVLNTCHIREKAAEKVYSELGRLKELRLEKRAAGGGYVLIRDTTCRLFGYHVFLGVGGGFALDHMFGF